MKTVIVLAMHGVPPNDFPHPELREFFELHGRLEMAPEASALALRRRYEELEEKIRRWPRTPANDPYHAASYELADAVRRETGLDVAVGFNEFCAPRLDEAMEKALKDGADRLVVVSTMLTRGGEHAEREIAQAVAIARLNHPGAEILYAWPFETAGIARFLAGHIRTFIPAEAPKGSS